MIDVLFADLPLARRREAASLAAHYVAGVLDRESLVEGVNVLVAAAGFRPGDRVQTLKGSLHGVVRQLMPDGRVVWRPDGNKSDLVALPESLVTETKR